MVSLVEHDAEIKSIKKEPNVDIPNCQAQLLESRVPPPLFSGENAKAGDADDLKCRQGAEHFDDTIPPKDAFETQVVNLPGETQLLDIGVETQVPEFDGETQVLDIVGETQVLDIGGETQALDIGGETQLLDVGGETQVLDIGGETQLLDIGDETQLWDDLDCFDNMGTQIVNEFDNEVSCDTKGEGTDGTEVLFDNDEQFRDESASGSGQSVNKEKIQCTSLHDHGNKELMEQRDLSPVKEHIPEVHLSTATSAVLGTLEPKPGPQQFRFTSVRTASMRMSFLAARTASKVLAAQNNGVSVLEDSTKVGEVDQGHDVGESNGKMKGSKDENMCRVGSRTARKLFTEDLHDDCGGLPLTSNVVEAEELPQLPACDGGLAGLSYVDSQEPEDLSQANALDFVDKFLNDNVVEFEEQFDHGKKCRGKSNSVPSANGLLSFAKKANDITLLGEASIYEWDDNREDEGGGEIFRRRKEEFFASESRLDKFRDDGEYTNNKRKKIAYSDSKLVCPEPKVNEKAVDEMELKRSLVNELDEQSNENPAGGHSVTNVTLADVPEMLNVGFDTQLAAEALETLFHGEDVVNLDANDASEGIEDNSKCCRRGSLGGKTDSVIHSNQPSCRKRISTSGVLAASRQYKKAKSMSARLSKESSISSQKYSDKIGKQGRSQLVRKRSKSASESHKGDGSANIAEDGAIQKRHLRVDSGMHAPIAYRTRQSLAVAHLRKAENASCDYSEVDVCALKEKGCSGTGIPAFEVLKEKSSLSGCIQSTPSLIMDDNSCKVGASSCHQRRRSHQNLSGQENKSDNSDDALESAVLPEDIRQSVTKQKRLRHDGKSTLISSKLKRKTGSGDAPTDGRSGDINGKLASNDLVGLKTGKYMDGSINLSCLSSTRKVNASMDESPREKCQPSNSRSATPTPVKCKTAENAVSPVCMGDEYFKQSCKRNLSRPSLLKEIRSLSAAQPEPSPSKDSRKRRDMTSVRVLYSQHLDEDIIRQQKKILTRLGISTASSIMDATHFIADEFVRTRNMLQAIASGKPVVTHLWLESCGQASSFIDEKNYILRDTKKEKEFGFSMPVSLARASQCPLLKGRRVLITPNTKPGKETISSLIKAVQGQALERVGRSALKEVNIPDDLLILSCEEDYAICVPFLEKGATVYSSELLLNGIVTQRLEYERHRLFADDVKRTRSTIWLRKDNKQFLPVSKRK